MNKLKKEFKTPEDLAETTFKDYYKIFKKSIQLIEEDEEGAPLDFFYVGEFKFKSENPDKESIEPLFWVGNVTPYWKKLITSNLVKRKDFATGTLKKEEDKLKLNVEKGKGGKLLVLKEINKKMFRRLTVDAVFDNPDEDNQNSVKKGIDTGELISKKGAVAAASTGIFGRILLEEKLYNKTGNNFEEALAKLGNLQILIKEWESIDNVETRRPEELAHIIKLKKEIVKFFTAKKNALKDRDFRNIVRDWNTLESDFKSNCGKTLSNVYEDIEINENGKSILPEDPYDSDTLYESYQSLELLLQECAKWKKKNKGQEKGEEWKQVNGIMVDAKNIIDIAKPTLKSRNESVAPYVPSQEFTPKGKMIDQNDLDQLDQDMKLSDLDSPENLLDVDNLDIKLPKIFKEVKDGFQSIQTAFDSFKALDKGDLEGRQHHLFELTKVVLNWETSSYKPFKAECSTLFGLEVEKQVEKKVKDENLDIENAQVKITLDELREELFEDFYKKFDDLNTQINSLLTEIYKAQQSLGEFLIDHDTFFDIIDLEEEANTASILHQSSTGKERKKNKENFDHLLNKIDLEIADWQDNHLHLSDPTIKERNIRLEQIKLNLHRLAKQSHLNHTLLTSDTVDTKEYDNDKDKQYQKVKELSFILDRGSIIEEQKALSRPSFSIVQNFRAHLNDLSKAVTIWNYESKQYKKGPELKEAKKYIRRVERKHQEISEKFQDLEEETMANTDAINQIDNLYNSFRTTRHNFEAYWNKYRKREGFESIDKLEFNFQAHTLLKICNDYENLYAKLKEKDKHTLFQKQWQKDDKVDEWKTKAEVIIPQLAIKLNEQAIEANQRFKKINKRYERIKNLGVYDPTVDDTPDKKTEKLNRINKCDLSISQFINSPYDFNDKNIAFYRRVLLEGIRPKLEQYRQTFYGEDYTDLLKEDILLEDKRLEARWKNIQGKLEQLTPEDEDLANTLAELSDKFISRREHLLGLIRRWENQNPGQNAFDSIIKEKWQVIVYETPILTTANSNKNVKSKIKEYDDLLLQYQDELGAYLNGEHLTNEDKALIQTAIDKLTNDTKSFRKSARKSLKKNTDESKEEANNQIEVAISILTDLVTEAYTIIHKVNRTQEAKVFSCFGSYDTFEDSNSLRIPEEDLKEMYTILGRLHLQAKTVFETTGSRTEAKKIFEHIPVNLWPTEFIDDLQLWAKVEKALALQEIQEIVTPQAKQEVASILQQAKTNNLALDSMDKVMGFISAPTKADKEKRTTYWGHKVENAEELKVLNEVFSDITLANGASTNIVNLINGVENHDHRAVVLSATKVLAQGCGKVAAIAKSEGVKQAAAAAATARKAAEEAGKTADQIKQAAEDAAKAVNKDVANGIQASFQGLAGTLTFIVQGIELLDKNPQYDPHATMQSIFDKELKQIVSTYTWAVSSVGTVSSVIGIFGDLASVCGAITGGVTVGINIINITMNIRELHKQNMKAIKETHTRAAAAAADDEILELSIQQSIDRRTQKIVQGSIETSGDILSSAGTFITASGIGAPIGTAFSIAGGALKLGTTIVFAGIEMGQTAEAKKMLKKARNGDRNAQKLVFGKHPFYAKMAIVLSAMGDNELSKDIARKYCVDLGFTEDNFNDQSNNVAVIKEAFKYLMVESGQLDFEHNKAKDFIKSISAWYKKFSKKLGFWTTSTSYERLIKVYNADQFREKIAFYINHEHHIGHASIKQQIKFIAKVLLDHDINLTLAIADIDEQLKDNPENFEELRTKREVLGEERKYAGLLLGPIPNKLRP